MTRTELEEETPINTVEIESTSSFSPAVSPSFFSHRLPFLCLLIFLYLPVIIAPLIALNNHFQYDAEKVFKDSELSPLDYDVLFQHTCIPQTCKDKPTFASSTNFTLLATFPGSGSTWSRQIVEDVTKVWTGSVYNDAGLVAEGFKGESLDSFASKLCPTSAIKTHYPAIHHAWLNSKTTGVILVMRNPFDAILAEFIKKNGGINKVSNNTLLHTFPPHFSTHIFKWKNYAHFWYGKKRIVHAFKTSSRNVLSFEFDHPMVTHQVPVLLMFYENFVRNFPETVSRLFSYVNPRVVKESNRSVEDAVLCANKRKHDETLVLKKASRAFDIYAHMEEGLIQKACEVWKEFWFEEVWGLCRYPVVSQLLRLPLDAENTALDRITEFCA